VSSLRFRMTGSRSGVGLLFFVRHDPWGSLASCGSSTPCGPSSTTGRFPKKQPRGVRCSATSLTTYGVVWLIRRDRG